MPLCNNEALPTANAAMTLRQGCLQLRKWQSAVVGQRHQVLLTLKLLCRAKAPRSSFSS
jgi:hypothetical protein